MNVLSQQQRDRVEVAIELFGRGAYHEVHRAVQNMVEVLDEVIATANDTARRLADSQCDLNTVCHERDDLVEEVANLRDEVAKLTAEIEAGWSA